MKKLLVFLMVLCSVNSFAQHKRSDGNGPTTGFKIFAEGGYSQGAGIYGEERVSFMASAGYFFKSHLFTGIGSGENYYTSSKKHSIPLYGIIRVNLLNNSISPFIDAKVGYSIGDIKGLYFTPSVGARWMIDDIIAFTTSIGYEFQRTDDLNLNNNNNINAVQSKHNIGALSLKIGFEF